MPRISTDNYDTVANWNGSQDLFVVEQPDGTKVATPAMVKQFIEAGDFEATGEIEDGHGNILKDMAKSSEIGDLSQTGLTGDSVAAQLSNASGQIAGLVENRAYYVNIGSVSANSDYEAMGKAWDALTIYDKPVLVRYMESGVRMALMLKYVGGQYGMAMGMKYGQTRIIMMGVNNGTKSYATTATT